MSVVSTSILETDELPKQTAASACVPRGSPHLSLVSSEGSPRSAGELTQAPFKFPLLPWVPECEILYVPFKSGVCFPQSY